MRSIIYRTVLKRTCNGVVDVLVEEDHIRLTWHRLDDVDESQDLLLGLSEHEGPRVAAEDLGDQPAGRRCWLVLLAHRMQVYVGLGEKRGPKKAPF
jgi:hypothetical protein